MPARLKLVIDRLLGPNADRAIVEKLLAMRAAGEEPAVPFRWTSGCCGRGSPGFIAVGGSLTPQWKSLALPVMHILTFSMQTAVVDQMVVSGAGTPKSVVLDDDALARAARLGRNVAAQLGRTFDEARVRRGPGLVPAVPPQRRRAARPGRRTARPAVRRAASATTSRSSGPTWTPRSISMAEKRAHYDEILETAQRHAKVRDEITEQAATYDSSTRSSALTR